MIDPTRYRRPVRVGLLGALDVRDADDRVVAIPSGKQRALLGMLAIHVGRVVPTEQIADALWGEDPPPKVRNGLQALASKLRNSLGSADLVVMRGGGYVLDVPADAVDAHRFEQLVTEARGLAGTDPARAVDRYAEADALWRGDALVDFTYEEFAQPTIARLTELRIEAIEERVELELALGRLIEGVAELEALVAAHPLRERLRGQLMVALYRAGRQSDALHAFQEGRRVLAEELGLEPGPELRRLETAILTHDASLDGPAASPARVAGAGRRPAIPQALTPLVGRDDELRELTCLLGDQRFVSLIGPGGVGKTRLAMEAARAEADALAGGGALVELAPVLDPASVRDAVASALDVPDAQQLADAIGERDMVVVLDNCEHVVDAAAALAEELLSRCPGLRLVATSREALRVPGETVWPVAPLASADAVRLFVDRAEAAGASLELTDEVRALIADVCVRLDGLPLAIELAAARTRALSLPQIATRLTDRFRLLTGGSRAALPRQQTLAAVVDWSYDLLFDAEQRVFERLSVFPGGCDLATAEATCTDEMLTPDDIADLVRALVDKSLVVAQPDGGTVRFTQLQTLAQYGHEKLTARGDARRMRDAMAAHFAQRCAESTDAFTGPTQRAWLRAAAREHDNLRAALEWAISTGDAETASVIAGGTSWCHWLTGTAAEGARWIDDAFACGGPVSDRTRALALAGRGLLRSIAGAFAAADEDLHEALAIFRRLDDQAGVTFSLTFSTEVARLTGPVEEARARRVEALDLYRARPDDDYVLAVREHSTAQLAMIDGDLAAAEPHYRLAADGFRRTDRPVMLAITLGVLADLDERHATFPAAVAELEEAVAVAEDVGMRGYVGSLYSRLAWSRLQEGDVDGAASMLEASLDAGRRLRSPHILFLAHAGSAALHRLQGRNADAATAAAEALRTYETGGASRFRNRIDADFEIASVLAACQTVLGAIAVEDGEIGRASELLAEADRLRAEVGAPVPRFQIEDREWARSTVAAAGKRGPSPR